ncbi:MAG: hypothetical protein WCD69_22975 [Xanthobacteraceae bacterium]
MSTNPKKDDEKAVFDVGEFGIGHNQGPPLDDREVVAAEAEADANADTDTQSVKHQGKPRARFFLMPIRRISRT